jgi:adenylosuccinate synthase
VKKVVVGLGFGDEGKGLVTDWLCKDLPVENTTVVRHTGGHQAGHCVVGKTFSGEKVKHVFSNFGSGTLRGIPTFWDAKTFDPVGFMNEHSTLEDYNPIVYVNPLCPVTTPFDKLSNGIRESTNQHGSVGVGFADTIRREEANYHLYVQDLFYPTIFKVKLQTIVNYYDSMNKFPIWDADYSDFLAACEKVISIIKCKTHESTHMIYEGSQGLLLDRDYGFFPHVTYARLGTQETLFPDAEYYLVTRAYQTRHGNGPRSERVVKNFEVDENEINVYNGSQGYFKTGVLDLDTLIYSVTIDKGIRESLPRRKNLVITCMDQLTVFELVHKGKTISFDSDYEFVKYIIEYMPPMNQVFVSRGPTAEDISLVYTNDGKKNDYY